MQVTVEARDLRRMFADLRPIMRNALDGGLLGICVENNTLICTANSAIVYERRFPCEVSGPIYSTVVYRDISEFLPGEGTATITISEKSVDIRTDHFSTSFPPAYGEIRPYVRRCSDPKQVPSGTYLKLVQKFQELAPVSKSMKQDAPIYLCDGFAVCKYPTIWLEVPYSGFQSSISARDLRTIANFNPKHFAVGEEAVEFYNNAAILAVSKAPTGVQKRAEEVLVNPSTPFQLPAYGCLEQSANLARVAKGPCKLTCCADGWRVSYQSQQVELSFSVGSCDAPYYTLDTFVEYLPMLFKLLGENAGLLTVAQNAVMFEVPNQFRFIHSII